MKSFFLLSIIIFNLNLAKADYDSILELTMNCDAQAKVIQLLSTKYHPEVPPKGRFPGIAASTTSTVILKFTNFSAACYDLANTYNLVLPQEVVTTMSYSNFGIPVINGEFLNLKLYQEVPFKQNFLPLYPDFHLEKLSLIGNNGLKVDLPYDFQEQYDSYHLSEFENFTDEVKLKLTEKILDVSLDLYQGKNGFSKVDFDLIYSSTAYDFYLPEIEDSSLLKKQADLYIDYLNTLYVLNPKARYFRFHVGGAGGQLIAAKLQDLISKGAIDQVKTLELVKKYPALLLTIGSGTCPLSSTEDILDILLYIQVHKNAASLYLDVVKSFTKGWYSNCDKFETLEVNELANALLLELK